MANRKVSKDVSDNIIAAAVMASSVLMSGAARIIEAHASDTKKVTVNKSSYEIPVEIGAFWFLVDTATHVDSATDIDTGAVAASTAYYLYAVTDESTISFKTSLSATNPTGYDTAHSKLLGGFTTDGSKDITSSTIWDVKMKTATLTDHGVLLGSGTDPITALGAMTNGQLVIGSTGADPVVASITDGEGIDTTGGAGTLTIACEDATATNKGIATLPVLTNLLTNSQWMACSGSTLCEVTSGAAPVTDGANAALVNNLLTNGGFDSATTGWTAGANAALTLDAGGKTGNCLTVTENGLGNPCAYQTVTTVVGKLYTLNLYIKAGTEATYLVRIGTSGAGSQENYASDGEAADNWTDTVITKTFEATETSTTITLYQICSALAATTLMFDSVTLYEITPGYVAADTLAPDGGTKTATLDIHRAEADSTHCKGYYGLKYTKGADTAEYHNILSITNRGQLDKLKGQTVTFGMAGYSVTATDNLKIQIYDGVTAVTSSAFWGADALGWKEISQAVAANATELTFRVLLDGDTADVAYGSFYMALNGSSIGEYNYAPKYEQILCDANITLTGYTATTSAADGIINLEAASSGMIGKGVKAVLVKAYGKDSAAGDGVGFDVQSASGVEDGVSIDTQVNNIKIQQQGWVKCDANGDIYLDHRGSGASALTLDVKVIGIEP